MNKDKEDLIEQIRRQEEQNDAQRIRVLQKDNAQVSIYIYLHLGVYYTVRSIWLCCDYHVLYNPSKLLANCQPPTNYDNVYSWLKFCFPFFKLNMKVKSLLDELDDIREKREASGLQSDHVRWKTEIFHQSYCIGNAFFIGVCCTLSEINQWRADQKPFYPFLS